MYRDRTALFFILVLPILIMVIIGSTFFGEADELPIGVIDRDRSELSGADRSGPRRLTGARDPRATPTSTRSSCDIRTGRIHAGS